MQKKILIEKILPKRSHTNSLIKIKIKKHEAILSWKNKGGGIHPKPVKVPRSLIIDEEIIALMGFFFGDGLKSNKGAASRTLSFTNSEIETVKWAMKLFRIFNIPINKIKASVSVRGKIIDENEVRDYWNKITDIPSENISVNIRPSLSMGKRNLPPIKKYGAIKIEFYSAILRDVVMGLLDFAILKARKSNKNAKAFLRGLAAAEGCPVINHGKLINVVISCCDAKNKKIIKSLVKKCNLIHKVRNDGIEIHRYNFKRKEHRDIFSYHPQREERFLVGLKSLKF